MPNSRKSVTSLTPASDAIRRVVVPRYPYSPNKLAAASRMCERLLIVAK